MKTISIICSVFVFIGCLELPIGYYTFLRIIIAIGAGFIIKEEIKKSINLFCCSFMIVAVLFNPIIPIYLYDKSFWIPIDIVTGILFLFYGFREVNYYQ